jgi:Flp pilus assembly CpaE family ATPase
VGAQPERRDAEALGRFAGLDDLDFLPRDTQVADGAMLAGRTLREFAPQSALRSALADLAERYAAPVSTRRLRRLGRGHRFRAQELNSRVRPPTV